MYNYYEKVSIANLEKRGELCRFSRINHFILSDF